MRGEVAMGHPVDKILSFTSNNDIDLIIMVTHGRSGLSRMVMGSVAHKVLLTPNVPIWLIRAGITREAIKNRLPIRRILVLLDGSKLAESVLPHVEALVKQCGVEQVKIVLLRVCEPHLIESGFPPEKPPGSPPVISMGWEEHVRKETMKSRLTARAYLDEIGEQFKKAGLTVQEELLRIYNKPWFVQAPIVICACSVPSESWVRQNGKNYCDVDVAIVMDHLILAAADLDLGTCWVGAFNPEVAREVLNLPDDLEPVVFTPLGYPDDKPGVKIRRPIEELIRYNLP